MILIFMSISSWRCNVSVIAGPRTLAQWQNYLAVLDAPAFSAEDEALVDSLVPAGHPSTPGFTDLAYPVTDRVSRVANP